MKSFTRITAVSLLLNFLILFSACGRGNEGTPSAASLPPANEAQHNSAPAAQNYQAEAAPSPQIPNLQLELLDERYKTTTSPIAEFNFKNYTYPLPRGWHDPDGKEAALEDGRRPLSEEEKKIGLDYVTTRFFDVTGDGQDEAAVILKINTGGSGIPQIVYVFEWRDDAPKLIWYFRTGDRADGGLKDIRAEEGDVVVELFGQDRYIIGELDTMKITGDEEQICCPTHFTRSRYRWNGQQFRLHGKRLTFSVADRAAPPIENMGEIVEKGGKK